MCYLNPIQKFIMSISHKLSWYNCIFLTRRPAFIVNMKVSIIFIVSTFLLRHNIVLLWQQLCGPLLALKITAES